MDLNHDGVTDLNDIIILCTAIITIITMFVLLRKRIVKPIARWTQKQFREAVAETVAPQLERITHEVTSNDGTSLKDIVRQNHEETRRMIAARDDELKQTLAERDATFARIAGPANQRVRELENGYKVVLRRLDELGDQSATDTAKVLQKIDTNTENIINQKD